jgi:glucokinase
MRYAKDERVVMTLDAGGTNLVFSSIKGEKEIIDPIRLDTPKDNLKTFLERIVTGFKQVESSLSEKPVAISFAFPGPADYKRGIICDLENLPAFKGGVALGPMLEDKFNIPVFINNDGDLFTYGEAISGFLPQINSLMEKKGGSKKYHNLFGVTFGTGFGGGIVHNGELFLGDNSAQGEINRMRNKLISDCSVEDSVSIRGVKRVYMYEAGCCEKNCPLPEEIYKIGIGQEKGNKQAAIKAFEDLGVVAGDALANAITLIDGLIVIGGGLSGAYPLFINKIVEEMNKKYKTIDGASVDRLEVKVFNLEDDKERPGFLEGGKREIEVPFTKRKFKYDSLKRIGIGITRLGTLRAVSIGAYTYALNQLDKKGSFYE